MLQSGKVLLLAFLLSLLFYMVKGQCMKVYESGVNSNDQQTIVNKHNQLRLDLAKGNVQNQPRACNMKRMQYDQQLGNAAQKIADTCIFAHVTVNDTRWGWVGQNLYMTMSTAMSTGSDWNGAIQSWFNEKKDYHYPDNPSSNTGHYTQVAWADSVFVGCGFKNYQNNDGSYPYKKLYVCNYGPGGNIIGRPPYQTVSNGQCGCQNLC